ncbi:MAG: helix-turn-helix transcriptional regulator [Clostridia bacterium]|nr:helix-turn-helix transcriptional regulator [Clostridia bacterium]
MGRISTKEDKTIYQLIREKLGYSREKAAEITDIEPFRIERIENEKMPPSPWDICAMATGYQDPTLCNHYCANECPIGMKYVPEITVKDLSQVVLEMIASLNSMKKSQERLIEITADGVIENDELEDFILIQKELERISITVETLQLWTEKMLATGKINIEHYKVLKETLK